MRNATRSTNTCTPNGSQGLVTGWRGGFFGRLLGGGEDMLLESRIRCNRGRDKGGEIGSRSRDASSVGFVLQKEARAGRRVLEMGV